MSHGKPWSREDTATLERMARAGYSDADIARHLGFKPKTIQRRRIALGYRTARHNVWAGPIRRWRERMYLTSRVPLMS